MNTFGDQAILFAMLIKAGSDRFTQRNIISGNSLVLKELVNS